MKKWIFALALIYTAFSVTGFTEAPDNFGKEKALGLLSDYGFFEGDLAQLSPKPTTIPYVLNTPLFSDYAHKSRFIVLPEGEEMTWNEKEVLDMPVGTFIVKNFYYENDERNAEAGRRLIETRILKNTEKGWQAWPYVWNEEQTDAKYKPLGTKTDVSFIDASGKSVNIRYESPNQFECKSCHSFNGKMRPIGPSARQLHNDAYSHIAEWTERGILAGAPKNQHVWPEMNWKKTGISTEASARAYLDANCGYCHRHEGPASTSGLFLHIDYPTGPETGVKKSPVAAGKGSGGRKYDIYPGKPEKSILYYRMESDNPAVRMPEVGRSIAHIEGLALVKAWIEEMK